MKQRRSLGCLKKKKRGKRRHGTGRLGLRKLRNRINTSFPTFDLRNLSPSPLSCCSTEAAQYSSAHSPTNPPQDRR